MPRLEQRIAALEQQHDPDDGGTLPVVVADDTPQDVLDAMRAKGHECYRFAEFVEHCV